ncbi:hypothetical protein [Mycobacterium timonense]|uniref:hypothetical protein n=1 Tax=Mycobacterium timonense TaxID=701043 RepID=UPI0013D51EAF|nr:hypothetical protein [Mycobacterium timonense]
MATISARDGLTMAERVAKSVDPAAVEAMHRDEAARANEERIKVLRHIVFRNAARGRCDIEGLRNEADAARLLVSVGDQADGFAVLGILRVAIDNRWRQVVKAGIRYFGEHPVAARIQELWDITLTTRHSAV